MKKASKSRPQIGRKKYQTTTKEIQVLLVTQQPGIRQQKGKYLQLYYVQRRGETKAHTCFYEIPCTTKEEAIAWRERWYVEQLLAGAIYKGGTKVRPKAARRQGYKKRLSTANEYISRKPVKITKFAVEIKGEYVGTFDTLEEARKARNNYIKTFEFAKCAKCGERARLARANKGLRSSMLVHDNPKCPNQLSMKLHFKLTNQDRIDLWNNFLRFGHEGFQGTLVMSHVEKIDDYFRVNPHSARNMYDPLSFKPKLTDGCGVYGYRRVKGTKKMQKVRRATKTEQ